MPLSIVLCLRKEDPLELLLVGRGLALLGLATGAAGPRPLPSRLVRGHARPSACDPVLGVDGHAFGRLVRPLCLRPTPGAGVPMDAGGQLADPGQPPLDALTPLTGQAAVQAAIEAE